MYPLVTLVIVTLIAAVNSIPAKPYNVSFHKNNFNWFINKRCDF